MARALTLSILLATLSTSVSDAEAQAQCRGARASTIASEARRARWLIGDDARFQASLDDERQRFADTMTVLGAERRDVHVFAATTFAYQTVWPFDVCTNHGRGEASFERMRAAATVGFTHAETGLHARVSVVGALDQINLDTSGSDDATNARSGSHQLLVSARFGHERWFKLILGYVGPDAAFQQVGTGNVSLASTRMSPSVPGAFVGATIPMIRTSLVTLVQEGRTELFSVMARDLRPGPLPFAFSLGPTYIREERQVVGLVRVRSLAHHVVEIDREDAETSADDVHYGASLSHRGVTPCSSSPQNLATRAFGMGAFASRPRPTAPSEESRGGGSSSHRSTRRERSSAAASSPKPSRSPVGRRAARRGGSEEARRWAWRSRRCSSPSTVMRATTALSFSHSFPPRPIGRRFASACRYASRTETLTPFTAARRLASFRRRSPAAGRARLP